MEAWCLEGRHSLIFCVPPPAGRHESQTPGFGPLQGAVLCFTYPGLNPIGLPLGGVDHPHLTVPYLGRRRLVSVRWFVVGTVCLYLCLYLSVPVVRVWHEPPNQARVTQKGDFPKLQHQGDRDKERDHHVQQRSSPISNTMACNGISSIIDASSYARSR